MKITVKMLQGDECTITLSATTTVAQLKGMMEDTLMVSQSTQRLVFRGKTLTDESTLEAAGVSDGAKIHLMIKKTDHSDLSVASSSKSPPPPPAQLYTQLEKLLRIHLNAEQTAKVVSEFRKNVDLMIDSMNFEDIERFAASNFTEF